MSPQKPGFNRGIWKELEGLIREWVRTERSLLIVTGPVFSGPGLVQIGENDVSVPTRYFKTVVDYHRPDYKGTALLLSHEEGLSAPLSSFVFPIDTIEQITGIDFYHLLEDDIEEKLESSVDVSKWFFDDNPYRK